MTVFCLMGGIEITVPDGLDVRVDAVALLGGHSGPTSTPPPGAPVLRITGLVLMGGIDVKPSQGSRGAPQIERCPVRPRAARTRLADSRDMCPRAGLDGPGRTWSAVPNGGIGTAFAPRGAVAGVLAVWVRACTLLPRSSLGRAALRFRSSGHVGDRAS